MMPRFQFRVSDSQGEIRKGTMEARYLGEAREIITKRGFNVIELTEIHDAARDAVLKIHTPTAKIRYRSGPAQPRSYVPNLTETLQSMLSSPILRGFMALLIVAGLLWMVLGWKRYSPQRRAHAPQPTNTPIVQALKLTIQGRVKIDGPESLGDVEITLDLPEIPYQKTFEWHKLKHPTPDQFEVQLAFESSRKAGQLLISAKKPGFGSGRTPEPLRFKPNGGTLKDFQILITRAKTQP